MDAELRRREEYGKLMDIGADVWGGGGALIMLALEEAGSSAR
jgi:maltose O-acetyltransferase